MAEVRTGVHVFAICVKTGIIFKMRSTSFFHVSVPNIYGTSSSTYLIIFLKVIPKVLFFNITQKFTNLLVQLSIFLIYLFIGTYRLSSHARLEAFVIQTKLAETSQQLISQTWLKVLPHCNHCFHLDTSQNIRFDSAQLLLVLTLA